MAGLIGTIFGTRLRIRLGMTSVKYNLPSIPQGHLGVFLGVTS